MSELTRCCRCTLTSMEERAAARGAHVVLGVEDGWISARYSDQEKPCAWFLQLTESCAC